ncbi:ChbG/HpnK family deacetylase [Candidatus Neomarinimicrobiota bacterium]
MSNKISRQVIPLILVVNLFASGTAQEVREDSLEGRPTQLLIRCDDMGMSHSVNMAFKELMENGIPFSASVMFACPWYQEAVEILREHPEVSVGVHLTLNSEWNNFKWGPVCAKGNVSSLVDDEGYFFPSRDLFFENKPKLSQVKRELRAQIEKATRTGLRIDYVDYHMGTAVSTPELRAIVEKLAGEYGLGISRYFGEVDTEGIYSVPYEDKKDSLIAYIKYFDPEIVNLLVFHLGMDTPELSAMQDLNQHGLPEMSKHRDAELRALTSPEYRANLDEHKIHTITYRELIARLGLEQMEARK